MNNKRPSVAGVILAAGASTRFGRPKQLLRFRRRALIRHAAEVVIESGCEPVVIVLGAHAERCERELFDLPVHVVQNSRWADGLGSSIASGLRALDSLDASPNAVLLALCDQPAITAPMLRRLIARYHAGGARIVAAGYAGTLGAPAIFAQSLFGELRALPSEQGARKLFERFAPEVASVPLAAAALDLDTPTQWRGFMAGKLFRRKQISTSES
jgi:molybdenum cofactor cytidylyltransferase